MGCKGLIHTPTLYCMSPGHLVCLGLHGFLGSLRDLTLAILAHCGSRQDGGTSSLQCPRMLPMVACENQLEEWRLQLDEMFRVQMHV